MSVPKYWREIPYHFRLEGGKCRDCGKAFVPYRQVCPYCKSRNVELAKMPRTGKVVTYSILHVYPKGFRKQAPYVVALIELDNGARVVSQITDCDPSDVKIGMKVEAVFRRISEEGKAGIIKYGYKFRPVFQNKS
ncbi:MAG: Zn-ribbon domain-containing OB-fold protein [Candidatus Asgardarchaeia archaeon]